ncbi:MAG: hypothetical protein V1663_05350 [archaeon]
MESYAWLKEKLEGYDVIFFDTNFVGQVDYEENICKKLHKLKSISEEGPVGVDLSRLNESIVWKLENIISDKRVFTIGEVVDELNNLKKNFVIFRGNCARILKVVQKGSRLKSRLSHNGFSPRREIIENLINAVIEDVKEGRIDPHSKPVMLSLLDDAIQNIWRVLSSLKIYNGPSEGLYETLQGISGTDHLLVSAAYGCFLQDKYRKVAVLSLDDHIKKIALKNNIHCYFDIIGAIPDSGASVAYPQRQNTLDLLAL